MKAEIEDSHLDGRKDLVLGGIRYSSFSDHDLNDLEFVLAQRKAMARRCTKTDGEHTCGLAPGHWAGRHLCRACTHTWTAAAPESTAASAGNTGNGGSRADAPAQAGSPSRSA